jgi:membrane protein DedA with SNARE-associated domain
MTDNPEQINQWLNYVFSYGAGWVYFVLFLACFIENIFPPFPGDSFIAVAGALVAADRLDLVPSLALVLTGGMASVMVMYALGRYFGRDFFMRKDYRYFSVEDIRKFEKNLDRWGAWLMVFSRFVVGFRSAIAVGAGIARYPTAKMIVYSLVSYVLFTGILFYLAMTVVNNLDHIARYFETYNMIVWPIVVVAAAALVVWKIHSVRTRAK